MGKKKKQKKDDITYRNNKKKEERNAKKEFQKSKAKYSREPLNRKNWRLFAEQLKGFGLVLRDIQGDGNCMFRSIADQLEGHQDKVECT